MYVVKKVRKQLNRRERVYDKEKELDKGIERGEEKGVTLQFSVRIDILNTRQKKLLNDFLNSFSTGDTSFAKYGLSLL